MQIDFNPRECEAMAAFKRGQQELGENIQAEFISQFKEFKKNHGDHCNCPDKDCNLHGNCVLCVQVHRGHGDHLPYCMQRMVNQKLAVLSELTEHSIVKEVRQPSYLTGETE